MKIKWLIILICSIAIIIYLGIGMQKGCRKVAQALNQNQMALEENLPSLFSLSSEDSNLISKKYMHKIVVNEVLRSKVRNPVSIISFDKKYNLIITCYPGLESFFNISVCGVINSGTFTCNAFLHVDGDHTFATRIFYHGYK